MNNELLMEQVQKTGMVKVPMKDLLKQIRSIGKDPWEKLTKYIVTQDFPVNGRRELELYNLFYEQEKGMMFFGDAEGILIEDITNVLNEFIKKNVLEVMMDKTAEGFIFKAIMKFSDGTINIDAIKSMDENSQKKVSMCW